MPCTMHWFFWWEKEKNVALAFGSPLRSMRESLLTMRKKKKVLIHIFFPITNIASEWAFGHRFPFSGFRLWLFRTFFFTLMEWPQEISIISLLITHIPNDVNIAGLFFVNHLPPFFVFGSFPTLYRCFDIHHSFSENNTKIPWKMINWHAINTHKSSE